MGTDRLESDGWSPGVFDAVPFLPIDLELLRHRAHSSVRTVVFFG